MTIRAETRVSGEQASKPAKWKSILCTVEQDRWHIENERHDHQCVPAEVPRDSQGEQRAKNGCPNDRRTSKKCRLPKCDAEICWTRSAPQGRDAVQMLKQVMYKIKSFNTHQEFVCPTRQASSCPSTETFQSDR